MDISFGIAVLSTLSLIFITISRLLTYFFFYKKYSNDLLPDKLRIVLKFGAAEAVLDILVIFLNVFEVYFVKEPCNVDFALFRINMFTIPPALVIFIWCCVLAPNDDYEPLEDDNENTTTAANWM